MNILIDSVVLSGMGDIVFAKNIGRRIIKWCSEDNIDVNVKYAFNGRFTLGYTRNNVPATRKCHRFLTHSPLDRAQLV